MRSVLGDIAVVELGEGVAGSYCAKMFADLGADVVKVEGPAGDPLRHEPFGPVGPDGTFRSGAFLTYNTNKRSVVIDPATADAQRRLWALLTRADLVVDVPGTGSLDRYGLSWDEVHARLPALTAVRITGFGATGPYAGFRWSDLTVQAASGTLLLQNNPEQDPLRLPGRLVLCFVGHTAALGALGALMYAQATGTGSLVDCAATEALSTMPSRACYLLAYHYRGGETIQFTATATLFPTGVYPCGDGYVAMMSTPQQLQEMLDVIDDDDLRAAFAHPDALSHAETAEAVDAAVYPWLLTRTRAEITRAAQTRGWPLAGVNLPAEVLAADHLRQRVFWVHVDDPVHGALDLPGPPARFAEGGFSLRRRPPRLGEDDAEVAAEAETVRDGAPAPEAAETPGMARAREAGLPLAGIRVADLTAVWSGPYATMLLGDFGAEVIRVENPFVLPPTTKGYQARPASFDNLGALGSMYGFPVPDRPDRPWNRHAMNNSLARNKLSVTIDTRRPEGHELLMRLVETCDVFIDNFKAVGLTAIGISISELQARNPRLVIVRLPPTGTTGDWAHYTGFGAQFDGLSGLAWLCGHRDTNPLMTPATTYMDGASGPAAAFATLAALHYRDRTGRGQVVELVQMENIVQQLGDVMVDCELGVEPERIGNRDRVFAPQGLYACRGDNRWLALTVTTDDEWAALAKVMGRPELADDQRYTGRAGRMAHHDELDAVVGDWVATQDRDEAFHLLQANGIAAGPLLDVGPFLTDPQTLARQWMQPLLSLDMGVHPHPGWAYRGVPQVWDHGSPVLGEHNEYVYKQILGVSDEDYERYRAERMLADDYLDRDGNPL